MCVQEEKLTEDELYSRSQESQVWKEIQMPSNPTPSTNTGCNILILAQRNASSATLWKHFPLYDSFEYSFYTPEQLQSLLILWHLSSIPPSKSLIKMLYSRLTMANGGTPPKTSCHSETDPLIVSDFRCIHNWLKNCKQLYLAHNSLVYI